MHPTASAVYHIEYNADALHIDLGDKHGELFLVNLAHLIDHPKGHQHSVTISSKLSETGAFVTHTDEEYSRDHEGARPALA